jgi:hypothetical protein
MIFLFAVECLIFLFLGYLIYSAFISDIVKNKIRNYQNKKIKIKRAEKLAQVKMLSSSYKEIESFISENADYLSDEIVKLLVSRLEAIQLDQIINDDSRKRIKTNFLIETNENMLETETKAKLKV